LAVFVAKGLFFETPILFILLRKINKIGVSKNFILLPKAAEYFSDSPIIMRHPQLQGAFHTTHGSVITTIKRFFSHISVG
jgi:hypothetical protein